jgi:hypothetical protein
MTDLVGTLVRTDRTDDCHVFYVLLRVSVAPGSATDAIAGEGLARL